MDFAHHEIFRAKVGKGVIDEDVQKNECIICVRMG